MTPEEVLLPDLMSAAPPAGDVFITGGSGRIGTALRHRLRPAGYRIRFTDIVPPADGDMDGFVETELGDQDAMADAMAGCRALVHLAGHPRETDWETINHRNFTGVHNAVRASRRAGVRTIIYASSNHYCGLYPADTVMAPDLEPRPTGLYGASKVFGEGVLRAEAEAFGITAFAWRICCFRVEPGNARELGMWLSHDDAARFVDRALRWDQPGFFMSWGVSANRRVRVNDPVARAIGYVPRDDGEAFADALAARGVDTGLLSEWAWLGGDKAHEWMTQRGEPVPGPVRL